jgi:hypothetical protein
MGSLQHAERSCGFKNQTFGQVGPQSVENQKVYSRDPPSTVTPSRLKVNGSGEERFRGRREPAEWEQNKAVPLGCSGESYSFAQK